MDDADVGSSSAAHSAREPDSKRNRGLISRVIDAFHPPDNGDYFENGGGGPVAGASVASAQPGMLNLRHMQLEDVAVPKSEIVAVPTDVKKDDLVQIFRDSGLTRLPVYKDTLDTPVGFIHLKDLALRHGFNGKGPRFNLGNMVRPLLFAPPSMPIGVLLQKMQSQRSHMALVVDEYGGVDGLVTIEDLIEQVVGEIEDEHDIAEGNFWSVEKPGVYLAQAKTPLEEFEAEIGMQLVDKKDDEEIGTLGGLIFVLTGRVPVRGEVIRHPNGVEFEIVEADPRRIKRMCVRLPQHEEDA